jgi:hypothetical protein
VQDDVFLRHLDNSIRSLEVGAVLNNLEKIYNAKAGKNKKSRKELAAELDLFFGAS